MKYYVVSLSHREGVTGAGMYRVQGPFASWDAAVNAARKLPSDRGYKIVQANSKNEARSKG